MGFRATCRLLGKILKGERLGSLLIQCDLTESFNTGNAG